MLNRAGMAIIFIFFVSAATLCTLFGVISEPFAEEVPTSHWDWPEQRVEIRPYLLYLKPHSAVLSWVTPIESQSTLNLSSIYGKHTLVNDKKVRYHRVSLDDLKPATYYSYEIGGLYRGDFTTPSENDNFSIIALGHTHGTEGLNHYPDELSAARILELKPEFVLHSGDTTYHPTMKEFRDFYFKPFANVLEKVPVFISPSNHDSGWPGTEGISYDNFRRLFQHDYGGETGGYYSFKYKNASFFALSYYTLGKGHDSNQYRWLGRKLKESDSEFNIVFLGGSQYPKSQLMELFKFLSDYRVDLVLGGDGGGVYREVIYGIPYYYTGTSGATPHTLRYIKFDRYFLTIDSIDAQGKKQNRIEVIHSKLPKKRVLDIADPSKYNTYFRTKKVNNLNFIGKDKRIDVTFTGINIPSKDFDGIGVKLRCTGKSGILYLFWRTTEMVAKSKIYRNKNEYYDRLMPITIYSNVENHYLLKIPDKDPLNGNDYVLSDIRIQTPTPGCSNEVNIKEIYFFKE